MSKKPTKKRTPKPPQRQRRCFVIGPMGGEHLKTLEWLAGVVARLLPDFKVDTPETPKIGHIMTHVIKSCDRADLVIANATGNNPNVFYEMAVLDAMGRACIPVKIAGADKETDEEKKDPMAFDRRAYRVITISRSPRDRKKTTDILRGAIREALAIRDAGDMYENPLTDFFGLPLSAFSPAHALARGYYLNLLKPTVEKLVAAGKLAADGKPIEENKIGGSVFDPHKHRKKVLQVVIPAKLEQVSREAVDDIVAAGNLVKQVKIPAPGRPITLHEWVQQQDGPAFRWLDVPTAMIGLQATVRGRRGPTANPDPDHPEYRELELDEINQFRRALFGLMHQDDAVEPKRTIELVHWSETPLPQ
jgi:hypothetical protein